MCENMQFCQVFGQRSNLEPLLTELFDDLGEQAGQVDTMSPPLFDGVEVNLQPFLQDGFSKCPQTTSVETFDVCTQTELDNCLSPMNSLSSISLISSMSSSEHGQNRSPSIEILQNEELQEVVNLESFESIFGEPFNNSDFSPENLFDTNQDIFNMNHGPL